MFRGPVELHESIMPFYCTHTGLEATWKIISLWCPMVNSYNQAEADGIRGFYTDEVAECYLRGFAACFMSMIAEYGRPFRPMSDDVYERIVGRFGPAMNEDSILTFEFEYRFSLTALLKRQVIGMLCDTYSHSLTAMDAGFNAGWRKAMVFAVLHLRELESA